VNVAARWVRFWFSPIPTHSYALLRILFGLLGCGTLVGVSDISTFWALDGLVPAADESSIRALVLSAGLQDVAPIGLYIVSVAVLIAMTVGFRTGTAVTLSLAAMLAHLSWNNLPLSGAESLVTMVVFCLMWADCGSVWSVDAWLQRRTPGNSIAASPYAIAPLRLIQCQIALLYLSTGLWKLANPLWRDGSALHYILNANVFHRFPVATSPAWEWLLTCATYVTLLWELAFAFALPFRTTRRIVLIVGVLMHLGMIATLEIGPFSLVMLSSYVAFLDPQRVAELPTTMLRGARRSRALLRARSIDHAPFIR